MTMIKVIFFLKENNHLYIKRLLTVFTWTVFLGVFLVLNKLVSESDNDSSIFGVLFIPVHNV